MDVYSDFATDEALEVEGRWVSYDTKTKFKIARVGNDAYTRLFGRLYKANKVMLESKGPAAKAKSDEVMAEVFGKTILVDWSGPVSLNGVDMPTYSQANAQKLCAVKDFRRWVSEQAEDMDAYKATQVEEDAKD